MTTDTQEPEVQAGNETPAPQAEQPSLQLADLVLVLRVLQAAAQRGAIRAEEMADVGALHNKLYKFLESTGAIQPPQEQPSGETQ